MTTLITLYKALFPDEPDNTGPFDNPPLLPADIFAFAGYALEKSGAYHHVAPDVPYLVSSSYRRLEVTDEMRREAIEAGKAWRTAPSNAGLRLPKPPAAVVLAWRQLKTFQDREVFAALREDAEAPEWWQVCLKLLMIADEASADSGFKQSNVFTSIVKEAYVEEDVVSGETFRRIQSAPKSLSTASEDVVCVQPKSRTPSVGCTLRSLSHHLALLPPKGAVKARWIEPPLGAISDKLDGELGLLLIPFPYRISKTSFRSAGEEAGGHWGWFDADQNWLPNPKDSVRREEFVIFVQGLIKKARANGQLVSGVVFPELSLDYGLFLKVGNALAKDEGIDFIISGISSDKGGRPGNFVAIAPFFLFRDAECTSLKSWEPLALVREKHHRWKLNGSQISDYDLGLDEGKSWWENLTILSRSLDLIVFKGDTTLTTLICEDLARVDPCQAVIRAIGPNLLIALLMDGPQIIQRWPGRYASVLTEDPGTSVLTFTSLGLISRQNDIGKFPQACGIALWSDESTGTKSIELPREADAVLLQLTKNAKNERTLDGREDNFCSHVWVYSNHSAVRAQSLPDWIRKGSGES
ncbi:hypothetical protein [Tritonibacter mobilis]|uniref:hypothetical protein n=1 Tax=Tritonibacter mobilis TaxID=379347 RepID=UPI000806D1BD|nr:hypothetical protein [Tritonibacter mobilis]